MCNRMPSRRWECDRCGEVSADEVAVMPDGTAWHVAWGTCGADCYPIEVDAGDPLQGAEEGIRRFRALADEIRRLRGALEVLATAEMTPPQVHSLARRALRGDTIQEEG